MTRIQSVLSKSAGRFISVTIQNTKTPRTSFSAKVVRVSPDYVRLYAPSVQEKVLVHKNSIRRVQDGRTVANSL